MPLRHRLHKISLYCVFCAFSAAAAVAQSTHYFVKLVPDFERQLLRGEETIEFQADAGAIEWEKQAGLRVVSADVADGEVTVAEQAVRVRLRSGGRHRLKLKYTAAAGEALSGLLTTRGWRLRFTARLGWSVTIHPASAPRFDSRLQPLSGR